MTDYLEIIKNQFFSKDNIDFIIKLLNNKQVYIESNQLPFNACNKIFNSFIHTVYTQKRAIKPESIEELLITLNKMAIDLIMEEYHTQSNNQLINDPPELETVHMNIKKMSNTDTDTDIKHEYTNLTDIIDKHDKSDVQIKIQEDVENIKTINESLCFFSEDSIFTNGEYKFELRRKNIKNISLKSFQIMNNLYNITDHNNIIEISEKGIKKTINIPIGCYKIPELIETFEKTLEEKCKSNIKLNYNKIKNQISLKGDGPFSFSFIENDNIFIPLRFMLGFDKKEYINNNTYLTNNPPVLNIYDNIYIKITSKEYSSLFNKKYSTDFNFYEHISFKYLDTFSQDISVNINNNILIDNANIDDISMEIYYRHINHRKFYKFNQRLKFLMIFNIEMSL